MQAVSKIYSLDRDAFPSLNGLPGETHHSVSLFFQFLFNKKTVLVSPSMFPCSFSPPVYNIWLVCFQYFQYIADNRLENNPWHGYDEWALKVKKKQKSQVKPHLYIYMLLILSLMKLAEV